MITLTENARTRVSELLSKEGPEAKLRMYVYGKGCAGLTYGFGITDEVKEDDTLILEGNVPVVVDNDSMHYLKGSEIDYVSNLLGAKFEINNPNAKSSCGCGDSFNPY
jgi:iron-sulfur cluster assembly accessory protein